MNNSCTCDVYPDYLMERYWQVACSCPQGGGGGDLDNYYTKIQTDARIQRAKDDVEAEIQDLARDVEAIETDIADTYSKDEVDTKLALKANIADVYSKDDVDTKLSLKANLSDVYDKTAVDGLLATKASTADTASLQSQITAISSDLTDDFYDKDEVDGKLADKASTAITDAISAAVDTKQDILVSGTNIKTINNQSLLGSGNIDITGGTVDAYTKAETDALLANKQDVSGMSGYATTATVSTKADITALTQVNGVLTAHTADTVVHVTQANKNAWNNKLDPSALNGYATEQWVEGKGYLTGYTETDPVFTGSPAYGITNADKNTWNTVTGKADTSAVTAVNNALTAHTADTTAHTTATEKANWNAKLDPSALNGYATEQWVEGKGYLTGYTETDPVFTGSPAYTITNADKTNWDTVSTKADATALTAVNNALTAHTADTTAHTTATEKANWNAKLDPSALNGYATEQWVEGKGYLTGYTETDPVFTGSPAYSITNADKTNWDTVSTKADTTALTAVNNALTAHTDNATIHVTQANKNAWNAKQDAISDIATIRSNASNAVAQLNGYSLLKISKTAFDALTTKDAKTIYLVYQD